MNAPGSTRRELLAGRIGAAAKSVALDGPSGIPESPAADRILTSLSKRAMACQFEFLIDAQRFPRGPEIVQNALELVEEVEAELSVYRSESLVSEVNRRASTESVTISQMLSELLSTALQLHSETNGAFDITAGPLSKAWGFYFRSPRVPSRGEIDDALARVGSQYLEWNAEVPAIRFRKKGLEINLASIGKGYALDRCAELLRGSSVSEFVLHGGQSSVLVAGSQNLEQPETGWLIGLVHPVLPTVRVGQVRLRDRALGTSGCQRQAIVHDGVRLGHIIDPRTGWPTTESISVTVTAPTAALADALSTAFSVMRVDQIENYCRQHAEISAIVFTENRSDALRPTAHLFNIEPDDWQLFEPVRAPGPTAEGVDQPGG